MKQRTRRTLSRMLSLVLALVMMLGMVNGTALAAGGEVETGAVVKTATDIVTDSHKADGDTSNAWSGALNQNGAGYLWADKSVQTVGEDGFTITYSTMGKSAMETSTIKQPVDLVLVIDHSGSMGNAASTTDELNTRMRKMIQAVNETIDAVMENPYSRVAVVMFHDYYTVLLPLDHYSRLDKSDPIVTQNANKFGPSDKFKTNAQGRGDYIQVLYHWDNNYVGAPDSEKDKPDYYYNLGAFANGETSGKISPVVDSTKSKSNNQGRTTDGRTKYLNGTQYYSSSGSTNIQAGLWKGMDILINAKEKQMTIPNTDKKISRVPALVLMTDGGATNILSGYPWNLSDSDTPVGFSKCTVNPTYKIDKNSKVLDTDVKNWKIKEGLDYKQYLDLSRESAGGKQNGARQETTAILLATLMTAAYYKAKVIDAYNNTNFNVSAIAMDMGDNSPMNTSELEWLRSTIIFHPNTHFKGGTWAHGQSTSTLGRDRNDPAFPQATDGDWNGQSLGILSPKKSRDWRWNTWWADQAWKDYASWIQDGVSLTYDYKYGDEYSGFKTTTYTIPAAASSSGANGKINSTSNAYNVENIYSWLYNGDNPSDPYTPHYLTSSGDAVKQVKNVFAEAYANTQEINVPIHPVAPNSVLTYTDTIGAGMHIDGPITLDASAFNAGSLSISLNGGTGKGPNRTVTNSYGQTVNLSGITVKVSPSNVSGKTGTQIVTITIPEALVPVRIGTGGSTSPIKFSYSVKLNSDWKNVSETGDKYYSNASASTSFTPSKDNHNYDTPNKSWDTPKNTPKGETPVNPGGKPADDQEKNGGKVTVTHDNNGVLEVVVTVDLTIDKVAYHNSSDKLAGAEFKLTHNCTTNCGMTIADKVATYTAEETAYKFTEILAGHTYTLTETKAPDDYVKPEKPLATVTVEKNGKTTITATDAGKDLVNGSTVKNKLDPKPTSLTVKKEWQDGKTPPEGTEVTVKVYSKTGSAEKKLVQPLTLAAPDWSQTLNDLPTVDVLSGNTITYSVEEETVQGYQQAGETDMTQSSDGSYHFTITNERIDIPRNITVTKVWNGPEEDYEDVTVTAKVYQYIGEDKTDQSWDVTLSKENQWTWSQDVPGDEGSTTYWYKVEEISAGGASVGEGTVTVSGHEYTVSIQGQENATQFTITNTLKMPLCEISGTKTWKDFNGAYDTRPSSISIQLLADGKPCGDPQTVTANAEGEWNYKFENLPQYDEDDGYRKITYTVQELTVNGYESEKNGYNFTNTLTGSVNVTVTKDWLIPKDYFNSDTTYGVSEDTMMFIIDAETLQNCPSVEVQLKQDGTVYGGSVSLGVDNSWSYTWTGLPEYNDEGIKYDYTVEEVGADSGAIELEGKHLSVEVTSGKDENGDFSYTITNTANETTSFTATKSWVDGNNASRTRPGTIQVQLWQNGSAMEGADYTQTLDESNGWTYTWTDLPATTGEETFTYTVIELDANGFVIAEGGNLTSGEDSYTVSYSETGTGTTITNTLNQRSDVSLAVEKVWKDGNDAQNTRPESVEIYLYRNGMPYGSSVTLSEANSWKHQWTGLDRYDLATGLEYNYTVHEVTGSDGYVDGLNGAKYDDYGPYTSQIDVNGETVQGLAITNKLIIPTIDIPVAKTWVDGNNASEKRPASVTVYLVRNGVKQDMSVTLSEENDWKASFENLPVYSEDYQTKYVYTVEEAPVEHYDAPIYSGTYGASILNVLHDPGNVSFTVSKTWIGPDRDREVRLGMYRKSAGYPGGFFLYDVVLSNFQNGYASATFNGLDKYDDKGNEWTYFVAEKTESGAYLLPGENIKDEIEVDGRTYKITIEGGHVTNTVQQEKISVRITKEWNVTDDSVSLPISIKVQLYADGVPCGIPVEIRPFNNNWTYQWTNLDKYALGENEDGHEIVYTVKEVGADSNGDITYGDDRGDHHYTVTGGERGEDGSVTLTNTYNSSDWYQYRVKAHYVTHYPDGHDEVSEEVIWVDAQKGNKDQTYTAGKKTDGNTPDYDAENSEWLVYEGNTYTYVDESGRYEDMNNSVTLEEPGELYELVLYYERTIEDPPPAETTPPPTTPVETTPPPTTPVEDTPAPEDPTPTPATPTPTPETPTPTPTPTTPTPPPSVQPTPAPENTPNPVPTPAPVPTPNTPPTPNNPTTPNEPPVDIPDENPPLNENPESPNDNENNPPSVENPNEPQPPENNPTEDEPPVSIPDENPPLSENPPTEPNTPEDEPPVNLPDDNPPLSEKPDTPAAPEDQSPEDLPDEEVPKDQAPPNTGETVMMVVWIVLLVASFIGLAALVVHGKRKKRD